MVSLRFSAIATLASVVAAKGQLALYWGQNSALTQQSLGYYCQNTEASIFLVSFLNDFGVATTGMNLANACGTTFEDSTMLHCPTVASDIALCQSLGKKVVLSLGGAYGNYGFSSDTQATEFADYLWNAFGGGNSTERPFDSVKVDGFDLDIENGNPTGYAALITRLRALFATDSTKTYTISGSPQCAFPDASLGDALSSSWFDYVFIQFYNNDCQVSGNAFNYDTWANWAATTSANSNVQLFVGVPGSSAAGSGYATPSVLSDKVTPLFSNANFGGISVWDASQAVSNDVSEGTFAHAAYLILNPSVSSSSVSQASSTVSSSASSVVTSAASTSSVATGSASTSSVATASTVSTGASPLASATGVTPDQNNHDASCTVGESKCDNGLYTLCTENGWVQYACPSEATCQIRDGAAQCIVTLTECAAPQKRGLHHSHKLH